MSNRSASNPTSRTSSKSPRKSTHEDFKAASAAVESEYNAVQRLKRLSIGNSLNFDPDLPLSTSDGEYLNNTTNNSTSGNSNNLAKNKLQNSINSHLKRSKSKLSTHSITYDDSETYSMSLETDDEISFSSSSYNKTNTSSHSNDSINSINSTNSVNNSFDYNHDDEIEFNDEDVDFVDLDPDSFDNGDDYESNVIWVPATAHPKISPENFKNHMQSTVAKVNSKIQRSGSTKSSLNRESSLRKINVSINDDGNDEDDQLESKTDNLNRQSNKPSLMELTRQLETLTKRAGLNDDDAVTLARSLSTRSIGITKIEKEAYSNNDSDDSITQNNDLNCARTKKILLRNKMNKTRESLFMKDDDTNDENYSNDNEQDDDNLVQMDYNVKKSNHSDFVANLSTNGWSNYRRQQNMSDSNNSISPSPRRILPNLPHSLQSNDKNRSLKNHVYKDIRKIHNAQKPLGKPHLEPIKLITPSSRLPDVPHSQQQQQQQQQQSFSSSPTHSPTSSTTPTFSNNQGYSQNVYPLQHQHNQHQILSRSAPKQTSNQNLYQASQQRKQQQQQYSYQQQRQKVPHQQAQLKQHCQQQPQKHQQILHQQLQQQHYQQTQQQLQKKGQQSAYDQQFKYNDRKPPVSQMVAKPNNIDKHRLNVHSPTDVQDKNKLILNQDLLNSHVRNKSSKDIQSINNVKLKASDTKSPSNSFSDNLKFKSGEATPAISKNNENSSNIKSNLQLSFEQNVSNDSIKKIDINNNVIKLEPENQVDLPKQDISKDNEVCKEKDSKSKGKSSFSSFFKIKRDKSRNVANSSSIAESNDEPKSTFKAKRLQSTGADSGMSSPKSDFISFFGVKKEKDKNKEKDKYRTKNKESEKRTEVKDQQNAETTEDKELSGIVKKSHEITASSPKLSMGLFTSNKSSESLTDKKEKHELKRSMPIQPNRAKSFSDEIKVTHTDSDNDSLSIDKDIGLTKEELFDNVSLGNSKASKPNSVSNSSLTSNASSSISNCKAQASSAHTSPLSNSGDDLPETVDKVEISTTSPSISLTGSTSTIVQTDDSSKFEASNDPKTDVSDSDTKSTELIKQSLRETLKQNERPTKPNQPLEMTDSAFGFPLPPVSKSTLLMLDHRFPVHVERAIYRLSHLKLADPKRPLRQQVLLSNFMYSYLNLVNHTLWIQSKEQESSDESNNPITTGNNSGLITASTVA